MAIRIEALSWQQHVVTVKPGTLNVGETKTRFESISGESFSIPTKRVLWYSSQGKTVRIAYNRLVPTAGTGGLKVVKIMEDFAIFEQGSGKNKVTLTVNKHFHKLRRQED